MTIIRRNRLWVLYVGKVAVAAGSFAHVFQAARAT
jgi:hypothetical protein